MLHWMIRTTVCAALLAVAGIAVAAEDNYTIYIDYNGNGTNMNASWSSRADEDGSAILCFGEGSASVSVCGNEPCEVKGGEWPCWEQDRYRYEPDFGAVLTLNVAPVGDNEVEIVGRIHRLVRADDGRYMMERDTFSRVEVLGDRWSLHLGDGPDDLTYDLNVRIEERDTEYKYEYEYEPESWTRRHEYRFRLRYVLRDMRGSGSDKQIHKQRRLRLESGGDVTDRADFEAPVDVRGVDSSVLFTQVTLKDVSERSRGGRNILEATFAMERQLAMGVQPSDRVGMTQIDGHMMMSSFQKVITLRPGRTLRIEIPPQYGERDYIRTEEYIELEWDENDGH